MSALVIAANMKLFADRIGITSNRMIEEYRLSTIDEIIDAETEKGNTKALKYARECSHSPAKLIKLLELTDVENRFSIILRMDNRTREGILPLLAKEDLCMGLYFFTQEKLLQMLLKTDPAEVVNVALTAFPLEQIILMMPEEDLAKFFSNQDLPKEMVIEQLKCMPPDVMQKFVESVTGRPSEETNPMDLINQISNLPDDQYRKFMASIDPFVQRQLTFQIATQDPKYLTLFGSEPFVNMLAMLQKPDMVKPMIMLNKETLVSMISELNPELMSIVAAQVDYEMFAKYLQKGSNMRYVENALMI